MRKERRPRALAIALLAMGCLGCKERATYTVVRESAAPSGNQVASLVKRHSKLNLAKDEYYVIVGKETAENKTLEDEAFDAPLLIATRGEKVQVRWVSASEIDVVCDHCGLETDDILRRKDDLGAVKVNYVGFPSEDGDE